MPLRVPTIASTQPDWNRKVADSLNRLITDVGTTETNIATNTAGIAAIEADMPHTAPTTVTADATVAATDRWIINNKSGSACVLTLPAASSHTGRQIGVKTIVAEAVDSASSNVVPLAGGSAGTVIVTNTAGRWVELVSDGTSWIAMQGVI